MAHGFEYLVCWSQGGKVTFVNGEYQGDVVGHQHDPGVTTRMYDSCPDISDYLHMVGAVGWELVSAYAVTFEAGTVEKLIFKRPT
jgi:hypothetical protein